MLTDSERERYQRQLPIWGDDGQARLKRAKVFLAGAGGLGSPIAMYLTVAGVGKLRIVDHDRVSLSNLNRQILHWDNDVGREKLSSAADKLRRMNPDIEIETIPETITGDNAADLIADSDLIMDAMDNFAARYVLNESALKKRIPFFHGAVHGFYGQATTIIPGRTACLRCVFPESPLAPPPPVVGVTCGVIGGIQAGEALKYLLGMGSLLANRLLLWDGLASHTEEVPLQRNPECRDCRDVEVNTK